MFFYSVDKVFNSVFRFVSMLISSWRNLFYRPQHLKISHYNFGFLVAVFQWLLNVFLILGSAILVSYLFCYFFIFRR